MATRSVMGWQGRSGLGKWCPSSTPMHCHCASFRHKNTSQDIRQPNPAEIRTQNIPNTTLEHNYYKIRPYTSFVNLHVSSECVNIERCKICIQVRASDVAAVNRLR
jgi:hypothetical protein